MPQPAPQIPPELVIEILRYINQAPPPPPPIAAPPPAQIPMPEGAVWNIGATIILLAVFSELKRIWDGWRHPKDQQEKEIAQIVGIFLNTYPLYIGLPAQAPLPAIRPPRKRPRNERGKRFQIWARTKKKI